MISQFLLWLKTFVITDEKGQTLAEYALLLVLIAIVVIVALTVLGPVIHAAYFQISGALGGAANAN